MVGFAVPPSKAKRAVNPKARHMVAMQASNKKLLSPWQARIASFASDYWDNEPSSCAMRVTIRFMLPRPKSHYGTGRNTGVVKDGSPVYPIGMRDDIDKLARAVLDGLTGVVFIDDSQVTELYCCKVYGNPCAVIRVSELPTKESFDLMATFGSSDPS